MGIFLYGAILISSGPVPSKKIPSYVDKIFCCNLLYCMGFKKLYITNFAFGLFFFKNQHLPYQKH